MQKAEKIKKFGDADRVTRRDREKVAQNVDHSIFCENEHIAFAQLFA
jgi:hypothetical protein